MKHTVIYHSADYDGIFCREIARKFLPDAELIGWNFGDPLIPFPKDGTVYILDLSPDCLEAQVPDPPNTDNKSRMVWIDHHITSIMKWGSDIPGYRIDGVAACRLAWQWFYRGYGRGLGMEESIKEHRSGWLPTQDEFLNRLVQEPMAVRLAGEYDIWDKRDPNAETFQYALQSRDTHDGQGICWDLLLRAPGRSEHFKVTDCIEDMLKEGVICQNYQGKINASVCKSLTWIMEWEKLKFLCVNHARFNSLFFAVRDNPETGHDALLGFRFDGKKWMVSLYHAKHRPDLDLSEIAKRHGGGGHRGACGFTCKTLPFPL